METPNKVEQTGVESTPSQATEIDAKPIQREEEAIGAVFDRVEKKQAENAFQEPTEPKEETRTEPKDNGGQQAIEAPAHWSEEDKALFKSQPKEVQDFLLKRNKALESDYSRKTQQLADQRRRVEALSFLEQKMQGDPTFRDHVLSYGAQQKDSQQRQPAENTPPDDPIEQIIWQAEQNVLNRLKAEDEKKAAQSYHARVRQTMADAQKDEMYEEIQMGIHSFINVLPEPLRPVVYQHLDSNPDAYMKTFDMVKGAIMGRGDGGKQQQSQKTPPQRKETVHRPLIEQGGGTTEPNTESRRFKDIRSKAASGDLHAIGAMFDYRK